MTHGQPEHVSSSAALRVWARKADQLIASLRQRLFSPAELQRSIESLLNQPESPFSNAAVTIYAGDPFDPLVLGVEGTGDADSTTLTLGDAGAYARVLLWTSSSRATVDPGLAASKVLEIVRSYWRTDGRDRIGGILNSQREEIQRALETTITEWTLRGWVAIVFGDIDHFKAWNDQRHQVEGDRLIRKLAAALRRRIPLDALVVRRGGDEFLVVMPGGGPAAAVGNILQFRVDAEHDLLESELPLEGSDQIGLAVGVAFISENDVSYEEMELRADNALKPQGVKQRGRVSVEEVDSAQDDTPVELGIVTGLSAIGEPEPFANVWLSYLSSSVETAATVLMQSSENHDPADGLAAIAQEIEVALAQIGPLWSQSRREAAVGVHSRSLGGQRSISSLDAASAIGHGLARSRLFSGEWQIRWSSDASSAEVLHTPCNTAVFSRVVGSLEESVPIPALEDDLTDVDARRVLLVQIGLDRLRLPPSIFGETVYVDDRPTTGGGLPDLWEAALAQIVASLGRLPNVTAVIVSGDPASGTWTVDWLRRASQWGRGDLVDELADKLGLPTRLIREAGERLSERVTVVEVEQQALEVILGEFSRAPALRSNRSARPLPQDPPLRRSLDMEGLVLQHMDGCKVNTAYEAFPIALEIVRQHHDEPLRDQVGREFTELSDFKILLSNPTVDMIPRYHLSTEAALVDYFQREFLQPDGKFRAALDRDSQLEQVLNHVADAVGPDGFATRRGLLVIPHIPRPDGEVAPLGLVSIRINPVTHAGSNQLNYSYTWRTVETLVGLPYSLYGSIKFGQYLTTAIQQRVGSPRQNVLRMGELSYIAHSLHMYLDQYAQNVARLIVNDATK